MAADFPRIIDDVTNEWLSGVLGATVTGYEVKFLEGGVLADAYKLHGITYAGTQGSTPSSVVLKIANRIPESRANAMAVGAYVKELNFFRDLAPDVPMRSPKLYGLFTDGSATSEYFVIVMEDLTAHSRVFDQVIDPPDEAFTRKIAAEAATMHAKFWDSPALDVPWLSRPDGRYVFALDALCKMSSATSGPFRELWKQMFGADIFVGFEEAEKLNALLTGPKCAGIHEAIYDILSSRPKTLLHGDLRADNVFRTDPAQGKSVEDSQLTYIDWQVIHAGPPGPEFTEAWMHSLPPALRAKDKEFLREYHDRLVALQPKAAAYTYEMLMEDYTLSFCFWWTAITTLGVGTVPMFDKPEGARMKQLWSAGLMRSLTAVQDLGCLAIIEKIAAGLPDDAPAA